MKLLLISTIVACVLGTAYGQTYNCLRLDDCLNSGTCEGNGTCTCAGAQDTYNCEYDTTSQCNDLVCLNSGSCVTDPNTAASVCACPYGYFGETCENSMVTIDCAGLQATYSISLPPTFTGTVGLDTDNVDSLCQFTGVPSADGRLNYTLVFELEGQATQYCSLSNLDSTIVDSETSLYTGLFRVNYITEITTSLDELYNLTCKHDGNNAQIFQEVTNVILTSNQNLENVIQDEIFSPVQMLLQDEAGQPLDVSSGINVGDKFKMVVHLTDDTAYEAVRIEYCVANNTLTDPSNKTYIFFEAGCPTDAGKSIVSEQTAVTVDTFQGMSILIAAFKFIDSSQIGLKCSAKICKIAADCDIPVDCAAVRDGTAITLAPTEPPTTVVTTVPPTQPSTDQSTGAATTPAPVRRRRRAAEGVVEEEEETMTTILTIRTPGDVAASSSIEEEVPKTSSVENCFTETSILSIIIVMGCVIALLLLTSFTLACVMINRRSYKSDRDPMIGHQIPMCHDRFQIPRAHVNESFQGL